MCQKWWTRLRRLAVRSAVASLLLVGIVAPLAGQDLASFEKRTTVHRLANGWTFIIVRRPVAPVFSFATFADVGSAQEVPGITGLAHMFEHMAFKGTPKIGTSDWPHEKEALAAEEAAYQAYQAERLSDHPNPEKVARLEADFESQQKAAEKYVVENEFPEIVDREGGVGLNAFTNTDVTGYFYSLPANKLELFAYLESERFLHPVFREFYKERDVVQEERRLRTESNPIGRLIEQFTSAAFMAHPYHHPVVGYMSDLHAITMTDAQKFFDTYYVPANLATAIVGDVDPAQVVPLLDEYFGRIPARPAPPPLRTVEPPQTAEKEVVLQEAAQPIYVEGYHKGAETGADEPVFEAIDDIMSRGRTSRLYRRLVRDEKIAVQIGSLSSYPGGKYPSLWIVYAVPAHGVDNDAVAKAIREEVGKLESAPVSDEELTKFKTRAKADLVRSLADNQGLANQLVHYQTLFGDWRELFRAIDRIDAVTKQDVQRVARATFTEANRTIAMIETKEQQGSGSPPPSDDGSKEPAAEGEGARGVGR